MQDRMFAGEDVCRTGCMKDRMHEGQDVSRTGCMQDRMYIVQYAGCMNH